MSPPVKPSLGAQPPATSQTVLRPLPGGQEPQDSSIGTMAIRGGARELAESMVAPPTWTRVETVTDISPLLFAGSLALGRHFPDAPLRPSLAIAVNYSGS
ncbi:hypothetical protein BV25DRAFT_1922932 [Artomyces pyxidatus]|uniref:Uncharacterized protein n=1 Tax=Artomyces pyxidatus TaxID=48021 RepID=A0ACB8SD10_9AGAM|nr:hypothetical protein BV25DRAFT_1922932 [Artomyces pyxidatus]